MTSSPDVALDLTGLVVHGSGLSVRIFRMLRDLNDRWSSVRDCCNDRVLALLEDARCWDSAAPFSVTRTNYLSISKLLFNQPRSLRLHYSLYENDHTGTFGTMRHPFCKFVNVDANQVALPCLARSKSAREDGEVETA